MAVSKKLSFLWYSLETFSSYQSFIHCKNIASCDLFIVDIHLPDKDGFEVIRYIRNSLGINTPIIVLSWYQSVTHKVQALNLWADDYITKPFSIDELIARMRNLLRRRWQCLENWHLKYQDISFDLNSREVKKAWENISLSRKEKLILEFFLFNIWRLITKTELINSVWEEYKNYSKFENTLHVTLSSLRKKLGEKFQLETSFWEGFILKS